MNTSIGAMPIIKLEVQQMKYVMQAALSERSAKIDEYVKSAVEEYCSDDNIQKVVNAAATVALESVIKDEVSRFFQYGNGRTAVKNAVEEILNARSKN